MAEKSQKKTVMIFGTFDGLHPGHLSLISQARLLGDRLIAVVARTETVERIKGHKPLHTEIQRVQALRDTKLINRVELGQKRSR